MIGAIKIIPYEVVDYVFFTSIDLQRGADVIVTVWSRVLAMIDFIFAMHCYIEVG